MSRGFGAAMEGGAVLLGRGATIHHGGSRRCHNRSWMNRQRVIGVGAALLVAGPVWAILVIDRPTIALFNAAVALVHLGFAFLIGVWLTQHPRGRSWLADRGAAATWTGLGGLVASPALVLQISPILAAAALAGLVLVVIVLSPVLSVRAAEVLERLVSPNPEVRPIPKLNDLAGGRPESLVRTLPPFGGGNRTA